MIFIANFKMMITAIDAINLVSTNLSGYTKLAQRHTIVLCPPATALCGAKKSLQESGVAVGGQTCGPARTGAFTGDISPADLAACGATHCLVGHSERRALYQETDALVAIKAKLLLEEGITPVVCIGETLAEYEAGETMQILERQLTLVLKVVGTAKKLFLIAYEPRWAIGTGLTPTSEQLNIIFAGLKEITGTAAPSWSFKLLYGGSVSSKTMPALATVSPLDGFLIGGASLDFQEFQKIVDYFC